MHSDTLAPCDCCVYRELLDRERRLLSRASGANAGNRSLSSQTKPSESSFSASPYRYLRDLHGGGSTDAGCGMTTPIERLADWAGGGHQTKRNEWNLLCWCHADKHASVVIKQGTHAILMRCWVGCPFESLVAALPDDLRRELFRAPSPAEKRIADQRRSEQAKRNAIIRGSQREAFYCERQWCLVVRHLSAELARIPDGAVGEWALTQQFHEACTALAMAEMQSQRLIKAAHPCFVISLHTDRSDERAIA
jgi:hypothetical protein